MFKSQGLFSSLPCPYSRCTLSNCIFTHPIAPEPAIVIETAAEPSKGAPIVPADQDSPSSDESRSRKKRIVDSTPVTSSHVSQNKEASQNTVSAKTSSSAGPQQPSTTSADMLEVLPTQRYPTTSEIYIPQMAKSASPETYQMKIDAKRKYTETFNAAARPFVPSKPNYSHSPPTPTKDSGIHSSINDNVRQIPLDMIFKAYKTLYASLPNSHVLARRDAVKEELAIAKAHPNAATYKVGWRSHYHRLTQRKPVTSIDDVGTLAEIEARKLELERQERWNAPLTYSEVKPLAHSKEELARWGYITSPPHVKSFNVNEMVPCHRCTTYFTPSTRTQYPCSSHWGKQIGSGISSSCSETDSRKDNKIWTCCQKPVGLKGCVTNPSHVRRVKDPGELAFLR